MVKTGQMVLTTVKTCCSVLTTICVLLTTFCAASSSSSSPSNWRVHTANRVALPINSDTTHNSFFFSFTFFPFLFCLLFPFRSHALKLIYFSFDSSAFFFRSISPPFGQEKDKINMYIHEAKQIYIFILSFCVRFRTTFLCF